MSVVTRSEFGFPFERGETSTDVFLIVRTAEAMHHIICAMPKPQTKLERAQAIAAEVRARKFPAPRRITPTKL